MNNIFNDGKFPDMKLLQCFFVLFVLFLSTLLCAQGSNIETEYQKAAACYHKVKALSAEDRSSAKWYGCIKSFEEFVKKNANSEFADDALFSAGLSYRRIYELTESEKDAAGAVKKFDQLARSYPKSNLADDALFNSGTLRWEALGQTEKGKEILWQVVRGYPTGDMAQVAEEYLKKGAPKDIVNAKDGEVPVWKEQKNLARPKGSSNIVKLNQIRKEILPEGEKITLSLSGKTRHKLTQTKHPSQKYSSYKLELSGTYLSKLLKSGYSYAGTEIIKDISPSQINNDLAAIDIVINSGNFCETSEKNDAITVTCKKKVKPEKNTETKTEAKVVPEPLPEKPNDNPVIVIDAGHGGKEEGAVGADGLREKDIVLQIAKRLGWYLRNKLGVDVNYTRIDDRYVSLDDRDRIATGYKADVFISIHANASVDAKLDGYQTYYLNNASDEASRRLAARENAELGKNMNDVEQIVLTMMQNENTDESRLLGKLVHKNVLSKMSRYGLKDRGLKSALFYVLVGAKCPAVLIETSFISNADEEKKLMNPDYQETISRAIGDGVKEFLVSRKKIKTNL